MSASIPPPDLAATDPGLPRFVRLVIIGALAGAAWAGARPEWRGDFDAANLRVASDDGAAAGGASGASLFMLEGCGTCHPTVGPSTALGPSLAGLSARSEERVRAGDYTGVADSGAGYVREAIIDHCVDLVPGYACPHSAPEVGLRLSADDVGRLVDYVARDAGGGEP